MHQWPSTVCARWLAGCLAAMIDRSGCCQSTTFTEHPDGRTTIWDKNFLVRQFTRPGTGGSHEILLRLWAAVTEIHLHVFQVRQFSSFPPGWATRYIEQAYRTRCQGNKPLYTELAARPGLLQVRAMRINMPCHAMPCHAMRCILEPG
eukprot:COSAG01_NODE_5859_length_3987_cov_80.637088_5_plen_148_part_00